MGALNKFPIYILPIKKQKMMMLLIKQMQNGKKVRMGPLAELNYDSASKVSRLALNIHLQ